MFEKIQEKYNYTDFETAVLKYVFTVFIGELCKILAIGCMFYNCYTLYLYCVLILGMLRPSTGGIHCRTYLGCLIATGVYFVACIYFLPHIAVSNIVRIGILILCMIINFIIGPVVSKTHKPLSEKAIRGSLIRSFAIVGCFTIFTVIYPSHEVAISGFWIILLNTLQLIIAKILSRKEKKE